MSKWWMKYANDPEYLTGLAKEMRDMVMKIEKLYFEREDKLLGGRSISSLKRAEKEKFWDLCVERREQTIELWESVSEIYTYLLQLRTNRLTS